MIEVDGRMTLPDRSKIKVKISSQEDKRVGKLMKNSRIS